MGEPLVHWLNWLKAAGLLVVLMAGCSRSDQVPGVDVTGRIYFNGQPLAEGLITFVADARLSSHSDVALSRIDALGCYQLRTPEGRLPRAGVYHVAIVGSCQIGKAQADLQLPNPNTSQLTATIEGPAHQVIQWRLP